MLLSASEAFTQRNKSFFKSKSKVMMAKGFNMNSMKATVGFIGASKNQAVDDLEKQERGGEIGGRSFIPMNTARVSKSQSKSVRKQNRYNDIRNLVDARKMKGRNDGQKFIKGALKAGVGGVVLADYKSKTILWRINSLNRSGGHFKLTALYSFKRDRNVKVEGTNFMQRATLQSAQKMDMFYQIQAQKQIKRLMK